MGKYMKRNVYDQMLRWKQRPEHTTLIVIIDEIQESAAIYNRIRESTRRLKSDFIITGSYLGLTSYFLTHIGCPESAVSGIVNENFVFLDLKQRIIPPAGIALETPAFATMGSGEVDFYLKSLKTQKTYAIEVKTGKNQSRTVQEILDKKKADYIVYAKGNTHGGVKDQVFTIPVYGIGKFEF